MKKIWNILLLLSVVLGFSACSNELDEAKSQFGYLKLDLATLVSTNTRATDAPEGYAPKTLEVTLEGQGVTLKGTYEEGEFTSDDLKGNIALKAGEYKITAQSANWDGSGSGFDAPFYYGETTVTVETGVIKTATITCTQANVKVTVNWDESFTKNFKSATSEVTSAIEDVNPRVFTMGKASRAAYFPVGDLHMKLSVTNNNGNSFEDTKDITDVKARDHYIINYKVAEGGQAGITVTIDGTTHTYTYDVEIPCEDEDNGDDDEEVTFTTEVNSDGTTGNTAILSGSIVGATQKEKLSLQYRQSNEADTRASYVGAEWITVGYEEMNVQETEEGLTFSYQLENLSAGTYEYKIGYGEIYSEVKTFEIQAEEVSEEQLYNGGFELWHNRSVSALLGKTNIPVPTESEDITYWDSSNTGSAKGGNGKITNEDTQFVHGGEKSAKLASTSALGKLAAASLFTGSFGNLSLTTQVAELKWGVPFTSRPKALKGYMSYKPGAVNIVASGNYASILPSNAPKEGESDHCQIYCALLTEALTVSNAIVDGHINIPAWGKEDHDSRVIAYGELTVNQEQSDWVEFNINLDYYDTETKPTHLLIVCSACKYGDYFHGSSKSVLYLDDFELVY